jgi:hypothetical protein
MGHRFAGGRGNFLLRRLALPLTGRAPASAGEPGISVAVLPLANPSGDAGQGSLRRRHDGRNRRNACAHRWTPCRRARSAFRYKAQTADSRYRAGIEQESLVEGSVSLEGDQIGFFGPAGPCS